MKQLGAIEEHGSGPEYKKMMTSEYGMVKKLLKRERHPWRGVKEGQRRAYHPLHE